MLDSVRIVMVETSHPGNIGAAARAMKTMGLMDLRLVAPASFPDSEATARASGAGEVLAAARVHPDLADAVDDATLVVGTSARQRRIPWPSLSPRELGELLAGRARQVAGEGEDREPGTEHEHERVAVLFGREDRGLTNEELRRCHYHVEIPANPEYGVLNVASAVQLIGYELRLALGSQPAPAPARRNRHRLALPEQEWDEPPADSGELEHFLAHLERVMVASGFLDPDNPAQVMTRMRRLFLRARPDRMEISTLRGVLGSLERHLRNVR